MTTTSAPGGLVGRDGEIARLRGMVAQLAAGRGGSVWVEGEPGIGKSALLLAGVAGATGSGCLVLRAAADEVGGRFPLRVLLECLRSGQGPADAAWRQVAGLLRGDGGRGVAAPADVAAMAAERLLDAVERLCVDAPVVLVADDLQWADELSLSVWRRLHTLVGQLPLLLVGACRPVPARAEVVVLRRGLLADGAVAVRLGPLAPAHVQEIAAGLVAAAPGPGLLRQAELAGGNPLYVRELVDSMVREHMIEIDAGRAEIVNRFSGPIPKSLAAALAGRLGFLSEPAIQVLRVAALSDGEFSAEDLTVVTGRSATELTPVVDEALAAGVVVEEGSGLTFRHGLIRQVLYEAMPASLRSALHRQAAEALDAAGIPVERVAGHLLATPHTIDGWVVGWVVGAAAPLTDRAPQVALDLLTLVRDVVASDDPRRERLDAALANALLMQARYDQVEPLARPVLAATSDSDVAGRMTWTLAYALYRLARYEAALDVLDAALRDLALTEVWSARGLALRALVLVSCDRLDDAETAASQAEMAGARTGDRIAFGYALHALSIARGRHGNDQAALEAIDRALAMIGHQSETIDLRLMLLGNRMAAFENMGRPSDAERAIGEALLEAEQAGNPQRLASIRLHAADHWYVTGRWDDALAELTAAAELPQPSAMRVWGHGFGALIASHRDDQPALNEHVRAVDGLDLGIGELHALSKDLQAAQAVKAERDGQPQRALAMLLSVIDAIYPGNGGQRGTGDSFLPDTVRLALAVGDIPTARGVTEAATALAERHHGPFRMAAAQHCRGLLAGDPALMLAAADSYKDIWHHLYRAQALENAAVLLAQQDQLPAARSAYAEAFDIYTGLDAVWDIRRADARLRPLGLHRGARGPRRRPASGWEALTPSELTVAELVATGRSNPDIAADLFLSRRTVQTHVSHILTKLGAHSRVDIARAALSRGETGLD